MRIPKGSCLGLWLLLGQACGNGDTHTAQSDNASTPTASEPRSSPEAGAGHSPVDSVDEGTSGASTDIPTEGSGGTTPNSPPAAGNPSPSTTPPPLGAACDSDEDCEEGLTCLLDSDFFGGRVANGLCTTPCTEPDSCAAFDPLAVCLVDDGGSDDSSDDRGYCLEGCTALGPAPKCHDRLATLCYPFSSAVAGCVPWCHSDADCDTDWHCNPALGVCQQEPREGRADGEPCSEAAECRGGVCQALTAEGITICSSVCSLQVEALACHQGADGSQPAQSVCYPLTGYEDENDFGVCMPACDNDDDCAVGTECVLLGAEFESAFQRRGMCGPSSTDDFADAGVPPDEADAGAPPPAEASGDAAAP